MWLVPPVAIAVCSYYVWAKIIEAFADLGYDPNMMVRRQRCALVCPVNCYVLGGREPIPYML